MYYKLTKVNQTISLQPDIVDLICTHLVITFLYLQNCRFMLFQVVIFMKQSNCQYRIVTFL